jgi:hypothetical protein
LEGDNAENRWCDSVGAAEDDTDATEPVEDFRMPVKDTESRIPLRGTILPDVAADT